MAYKIIFREKANDDIEKFKKAGDIKILKKLSTLLKEIKENPRVGTGKPERLKYYNSDTWSRRLTDKHRLVYTIIESQVMVEIASAEGHYDDK